MTSHISAELRRIVRSRAGGLCEYCLIHESDTFVGCQIDHVISEKHGGPTDEGNLAFACSFCNRAKGTDVGSISSQSGEFTRFFNPRADYWGDHFAMAGVIIQPCTAIGEVTVRILGFNASERIPEREALVRVGRYPPDEAAGLIRSGNA